MKHIKYFFFIAMSVLLLASCSKKNDDETTAEKILGKWILVNEIYKDKRDGKTETVSYTSISTVDFSSNKTATIKIDENENGRIDSDEIEVETYKIEGNLIVFGSGTDETYKIETLNETNLTLFQSDSDYDYRINFKR